MSGRVTDDGLSEVIGFILIIGLLVVVLSLYITYVVPSEGRTNEINQMDYIKQQFLDYKLNTDSLWLNNQIGASIIQALTMGTAGETTTGMFGGFSLVSPVGSGGSVLVNPMERSERMHITVAGVTQNDPAVFTVVDAPIIDGISPRSVNVDSSQEITLTGSGFDDGTNAVEVFFKGSKIESLNSISDNEIKFNNPLQKESGLIHIYVKKPQGTRSNYESLLIKNAGSNSVPLITKESFSEEYYVAGDNDDITITAPTAVGNCLVFVGNIYNPDGLTIHTTVEPFNKIFDHPNVVPITIVNPLPGGGSSSVLYYILPNTDDPDSPIDSPEIWGITPKSASKDAPTLPSGLIIYGAGFNDGAIGEKTQVWWNDDSDTSTLVKDPINPNYVIVDSKNKIRISPDFFNGQGRFDQASKISISVRDQKSSDSIQSSRGSLLPIVPDQYPSSSIPLDHFYIRFEDTGYDTNGYHVSKTLEELLGTYYGIQLKDEYNDITIQIKAIIKIISADWDTTNDPAGDPEEANYFVTYQTDLILNLYQGSNKIMENYVIKSDIKKSVDGSEEIWFDLLNPAYGINEYIKYPFTFEVTNPPSVVGIPPNNPPPENPYEIDYVLLANSIDAGIIIDNALGGLEYRSRNYYYRTQQNFVYQSGGVFVEQPDGSNPLVLPPISISRNGGYLVVGIANIPMTGYDNVAGSSEVQVFTSLDSVQNYDTSLGIPNAKSVILHIDPTTPTNRARWYTALKAICESARNNGVPVAFSESDSNYADAWVRIEKDGEDNPPILNIRGPDHENLGAGFKNRQDIILNLKTPELAASLNPVGKAVSIR